jgi:hypothetical protein
MPGLCRVLLVHDAINPMRRKPGGPKVTMRAPSFALEELATGETIEMKDFWKKGVTVIEFGSFT